jgi:hypothetical protein
MWLLLLWALAIQLESFICSAVLKLINAVKYDIAGCQLHVFSLDTSLYFA